MTMSMNCFLLALLAATVALSCRPTVATVTPSPDMHADLAYLASPDLEGRRAGTLGADSAAMYIARRYEQMQLEPVFPSSCQGSAPCLTYFQPFRLGGAITYNVAALVPGTDSLLRGEFLVIGAHYDHIGRSKSGALDPEAGNVIHPGADDNASGSAVLLELARRLANRPLKRSVLLVHLGAEELGLVGSRLFVDRPPVPRQAIRLMLNLDMVGRMRSRTLIVFAPPGHVVSRSLLDSATRESRLRAEYPKLTPGMSDHVNFQRIGVQSIFFTTGLHQNYHRASDVAKWIDLPGMERIADVSERVVRSAGNGNGAALTVR